jgi:hypothetical protein
MPNLKLKYLLLSAFILIFFTACMHKQTDGKYHTKYSYHPYYKMYREEMAGGRRSDTSITYRQKQYKQEDYNRVNYRKKLKHKVSYNIIDDAPSNVPIGTYSKDDY